MDARQKNIPSMALCLFVAVLLLVSTASAAAPTAAFGGTPASGAAPLTVQFTDDTTGSPTGRAWFFGDETYDQAWTRQTGAAGWSAREGYASVALPDGSIVVMGGDDGSTRHDVWRSTDYGTHWTCVNNSAGWTARKGHAAVALPDGSIVLTGGEDDNGDPLDDVWLSDDGGETWTCVNDSPGWVARSGHTTVVVSNTIILMGGYPGGFSDDVWRSGDGGKTWNEVETTAPMWSARAWHTSVALPGGRILLMGGVGFDGMNFGQLDDVWLSSNDFTTWTQLPDAGWTARESSTAVAMPDGSVVLTGGWSDGNVRNDTWRSTDNGMTWTPLPDADWPARAGHASVALPDGSIVVVGGPSDDGDPLNDTWRLQPAGSTAQNPSHTYTAVGTYTATLQAYNDDGYDSAQQSVTVTAPVAPTAAFTATPRSGAAPLTVDFTDTSTGSPTVWNWSFGDGTWHNTTSIAEKNPIHTYTTAGVYTVGLTVTNAEGSDIGIWPECIRVSGTPPEADFSGTPRSGAAPLTVDFTDASTGSPTGWAWFFGDETYGEAWTEQTDAPGWTKRCGHTAVALPDGTILLMGGEDDSRETRNDTWRSFDRGTTWEKIPWAAEWAARFGHTGVALPDGSIVLMGGTTDRDTRSSYHNDVWVSTDNGLHWTNITPQDPGAIWPARYCHTSVVLQNGDIVLMGGLNTTTCFNDVWRSTDGGETWTQLPDAGWSARYCHTSVVMPNGDIVLMGGLNPTACFNDVWRSANGGETWTQLPDAGWPARGGHTSVALPDGSIVLTGGLAVIDGVSTYLNDAWRSTDGGATWTELPDAGWEARYRHVGVALPDGSIVLTGGYNGTRLNDIWRLQPAGSSLQNPSHTYTTPGTYSVALQAYSSAGYGSTQRTGYIIATTSPTPTPTRRPVHSGGGGGGSTGGPEYNVGGDSAVSMVNVTGTGIEMLIVTGWKQSSPGSGIPPAPGIVYQYVDLVPARFENITGAGITFTVPAAWLEEHGLTPEEIVMYHYNGTAWEALPTVVESTAGSKATFTATSPGFSLFAITGIEQAGEAVTTPTAAQTPSRAVAEPTAEQTTAAPPAGGTAPDFPLPIIALVAGVVLVLAAGGYLVRRWWIRRQNPALFRDYD